jgi:hypothetical protein
MALKYFGNELLRAGASDAAADVFYRLLLEAEDKQQQSEYLQLCLACWSSTNSKHHTHHASAPAAANAITAATTTLSHSSSSKSQEGSQMDNDLGLDDDVINKLAAFVERQQGLSMGSIIDMLETAHVGQTASLRLCNTLLSRAVAGIGPLSDNTSSFFKIVDLLMRCIQLNQQQSQRQLQHVTDQLQTLAKSAAAGSGASSAEAAAAAAAGVAGVQGAGGGPLGSPRELHTQDVASQGDARAANNSTRVLGSKSGKGQRGGSKNKPLQALGAVIRGTVARRVATAALAVVSLSGKTQLGWRAARLAPLLLLLSNHRQ